MTVLSRAGAGRRRMSLTIVMVLVATALGVSLVRPPGARAEAAWTAMPPLTVPRAQPVVTVLADGDMLALGGDPPSGFVGAPPLVSSAEVYDRLNDEWSPARPPTVPRADGFTATLLSGPHCGNRCGKVLVVGGRIHGSSGPSDLAELYDPKCGASPADPAEVEQVASACAADAVPSRLTVPRMGHTATLLGGPACVGTSPPAPSYCGKVLVVGGMTSDVGVTGSAELYDPVAGTWTAAGALPVAVGPRWGHTATPLSDGRVVIVGGSSGSSVIYDPSEPTAAFKELPGPTVPRLPFRNARNGALHTATAVPVPECDPAPPFVPCARLLVTGGHDAQNKTPWAEFLELTPERQELKVAGAREAVTGGTFTLTFKGQTTGTLAWNATAAVVQEKLTALSLIGPKGAVVAGGPFPDMPIVVQFTGALRDGGDQPPIVVTSALTISEDAQRAGATADVIAAEKVKGSNAWVPTGATVHRCAGADTRTCRVQHTARALPGGRVLVAGGRTGTGNIDPPLASAEVFDPTATTVDPVTGTTAERGTWAASDPMSVARFDHTAVDLTHGAGKVVVVGGRARAVNSGLLTNNFLPTTSVEVFTPATEPAAADLAVTMVDTPDPVAVGEVLTYEATVTNAGPDTAAIPTLAVTLGARLVFESAEPAGICSLGASGSTNPNEIQRVTCRLDDMENNDSVLVTIKARVASSEGPGGVGGLSGVIISSAHVSSPTPEPSESSKANNIAYASTTPIAARNTADLALDASGTPEPPGGLGQGFPPGREIIHRLTATNHGPDSAHGVTLEALVPSGATVTPTVGTTCIGDSHVTCDFGSLADKASATLEIRFKTNAAHSGRALTAGVIRASEVDPELDNNAASWSNSVEPQVQTGLFDLEVERLTATPDPAVKNKRISYTIRVRNNGPAPAPNVVVQDYPRAKAGGNGGALGAGSGATETSGYLSEEARMHMGQGPRVTTGGAGQCITRPPGADPPLTLALNPAGKPFAPGPDGVVTCLLGTLGPDEAAELSVQHDVGSSAGTILNIAEVYSVGFSVETTGVPKPEPDTADNQLRLTTPVNDHPPGSPVDIWATMSDAPDPVAVGQDLTYTVEVGNDGDGQATSVSLEDPLPDGVVFKSVTTTKGTCAVNNTTLRCSIGNLDEDERATVTVVVVPQASFASTISNVATVSSLEGDAVPANNVARATTTVSATQSSADLAISVADAPDPVTVGTDLTYTVRVVNRGPHTSHNAGVTDTLPQGAAYRSSSASRGGCSHDSGTVTCAFGHLANGAEATATIVVRPTSAGTVTNTARVTSGTTDPDDTNNSATTQTRVNAAPTTTTTSTATPTTSTSTTSTSTTTTSPPSSTSTNPHSANSRPREDASKDHGYTLVGSDGGIFNYGTAKFHGSTGGLKLNEPVVGMTIKPGGSGYWLVARDGGIFNFGDAAFFGSAGDLKLNAPILGMEATPSGNGYYLFGADGGIFTFGDAKFHGSTGDRRLNAPVVGLAVNEKSDGYWLVGRDGGIFTFGNAPFHGSTGDKKLNEPVFDMAPTGGDKGYWLLARDGGIFSFGDVEDKFYGSAVGSTTSAVIGIAATPTFKGYWIADANGTVLPFGDATFLGDRRSASNNATIVGFATVPKI